MAKASAAATVAMVVAGCVVWRAMVMEKSLNMMPNMAKSKFNAINVELMGNASKE